MTKKSSKPADKKYFRTFSGACTFYYVAWWNFLESRVYRCSPSKLKDHILLARALFLSIASTVQLRLAVKVKPVCSQLGNGLIML